MICIIVGMIRKKPSDFILLITNGTRSETVVPNIGGR